MITVSTPSTSLTANHANQANMSRSTIRSIGMIRGLKKKCCLNGLSRQGRAANLRIFVLASCILAAQFCPAGLELKDGDKIAILTGQSFDIWNWSPSGYMRLLTGELAKAGVKKELWIPLEGQKTAQMLERLDADVIAKRPAYTLIIPGTADYNPFAERKVAAAFTNNLEAVLVKLQAAGLKTALATSYASNSNRAFSPNANVAEHNEAIRALARAHGLPLIDFVKVVDGEKTVVPLDGSLAAKGIVNQMFAGEVLRALGYGDSELAACRRAWLDKPGAIQFMPSVSVNTYARLKAAAAASGKDVGSYMTEVLREQAK